MAKPPPSLLDFEQILPAAFDEANGVLRTSATLVATGESSIIISQTDDSIRIGDGVDLFTGTAAMGKIGLDVNVIGGTSSVTGQISFSGLSTGLSTQAIMITDVPTKVPAIPLANRNAMSVRVWSNVTIYFGDSTVSPEQGYPKLYKEEIILDISDTSAVDLWAICDLGVTGQVRILQLA